MLPEPTTVAAIFMVGLDESYGEEARYEPEGPAEEAENLDRFPSVTVTIVGWWPLLSLAVDCCEDDSEPCPPANREGKVGQPADLPGHGGNNARCA